MFSTLTMLESLQFDRRFWSYERKDYWFEKLTENILNPDYQQRRRSHFRMSGSTFNILISLLRPQMKKRDTNFRKAIPVERRIVSEVFSIGQSTPNEITALFCCSIFELVNHFIKFLETRVETENAIEKFKLSEIWKIPMVVGALDETHIKIVAPDNESKVDY